MALSANYPTATGIFSLNASSKPKSAMIAVHIIFVLVSLNVVVQANNFNFPRSSQKQGVQGKATSVINETTVIFDVLSCS